MTNIEYNELADLLHRGHELDFRYDGKRYFLEKIGDREYEFYDMTDENNGILLSKTIARDNDLVSAFLSEPIIGGKSFNEIYPYINEYYIE